MKQRVVVIGAGIGGLSVAIQLAYRGFSVTVVEKQDKAGGLIGQIKKDGFTFDTGPSYIMGKEIYEDFFSSVGATLVDYIGFKRLKESSRFLFADGSTFSLFDDKAMTREAIASFSPGDEEGFDKFLSLGKDFYALMYHGPKLARRNYHKLFGFDYLFDPRVVGNVTKLHLLWSWDALVNTCFVSQKLRQVFSYQASFVGMSPQKSLAAYSFLTWLEVELGLFSVVGGVYSIVNGFVKLAKELGVKFHFNTEVTGLQLEATKVTEVITKLGNIQTDIVVNNSNGAYFYTHLFPSSLSTVYTEEKLRKMHLTCSFFTMNLGLKKPLPGLAHHSIVFGDRWDETLHNVSTPNCVAQYSGDNLSYYLTQETDALVAPDGKASLFVLVPVCGYDPDCDWKQHVQRFEELIFETMEKRDGLFVRELIETKFVRSPVDLGKQYNLWHNVALGFSHNFFQVNGFRMPNKAREFSNLYHVGASTIPGAGVPTCITSGELVAQRIAEEMA